MLHHMEGVEIVRSGEKTLRGERESFLTALTPNSLKMNPILVPFFVLPIF